MVNHDYKVGDRVTVHKTTLGVGGRPIIEGEAIVRRVLNADDAYEVEFVKEPGATYDRVVTKPE